jgi:hypothetical protein|tara:strand:- start:882 stop:1040 length:159 start_codon:yes stop_codon:yes gene_type:complete
MRKYLRNPRKKEMSDAYGELQDEGRNKEEEVQVHKEGSSGSEKDGEADRGED